MDIRWTLGHILGSESGLAEHFLKREKLSMLEVQKELGIWVQSYNVGDRDKKNKHANEMLTFISRRIECKGANYIMATFSDCTTAEYCEQFWAP